MKLTHSEKLDALCGEYLLGSLRGPARRRFERALVDEPAVKRRLQFWQARMLPTMSEKIAVRPAPASWKRLSNELGLHRYRPSLWARVGFWRAWAATASAALAVVVVLNLPDPAGLEPPSLEPIARLVAEADASGIQVLLSADGSTLQLAAERPMLSGPDRSYELWYLPPDGSAPVSVAVVGDLDARFRLAEHLLGRLVTGASLAVSVEPAGGSPTGAPTGPVILVGAIQRG